MTASRAVRCRVAFVAAVILSGGSAAADARDISARVEEQWKSAGAHTTVVPSRFLFDDETIVVPVPVVPEDGEGCTQIAIIGARGLGFRASLSDAPTDPLLPQEASSRGASTAGVLELRRCGSDRPRVRYVAVTAESGRGAIEMIIGRSSRPMAAIGTLLPERTGGVIPPPAEAGALPTFAPQDKRADAAEARARREGATVRPRLVVKAGSDGGGEEGIDLEEGCHRIEVFGREPSRDVSRERRRMRLDVDAELRDAEHLMARDRTEAPDARLETCVGAPTHVLLVHAGSPARSDVFVTRATWPLPARVPALWGPATRSRMARVLFVRHVAVPPEDPVLLAQGAGGAAPLPLSVEAGACYVAVVGVSRGKARQLQLRVLASGRESTDERGATDEAALAAFCVRAEETPKLEVIARGTGVAWGLALFRVRSGVWEAGR